MFIERLYSHSKLQQSHIVATMFVLNIKNAFVCMFLVFRLQVITRICPLPLELADLLPSLLVLASLDIERW
jgi:hypothetical protein